MHAHSHTLRLEPKRVLCCSSSALFFLQVHILLATVCVNVCRHARARTSCLLCSHSRACTLLHLHVYAPAHPHDCPLLFMATSLSQLALDLSARRRASSLSHFFHLHDAPPSSSCNRAPSCFLFLFPPSLHTRPTAPSSSPHLRSFHWGAMRSSFSWASSSPGHSFLHRALCVC